MEKVEQVMCRANGTEIKIIAEPCFGPSLKFAAFVHVHYRESASHPWKLASDRPHPDWRTMSLDDYKKHGRAEIYQLASHGEILKASNTLRLRMGM